MSEQKRGELDIVPEEPTWFCAGIIWRIHDGILEFLTVLYREDAAHRSDIVQEKFPGGTNTDANRVPNEDSAPHDTLLREIQDEVGLTVTSYIVIREVPKPQTATRPAHRQYFCLARVEESPMRSEPLWDGGDLIDPPKWRAATELEQTIFFSHRSSFEIARNLIEFILGLS